VVVVVVKKEDDFVNFGSKEACCNFVKHLYNFANQIDLDPFEKKTRIWKIEVDK